MHRSPMNLCPKIMNRIIAQIKYIYSVFRTNLHVWMVYRLRLVVWILSGIIEPIVWSILWFVTASQSDQLGMTGPEILTYYLFITLVSRIAQSWTFDDLRREIVHGEYSKYLIWPKGVTGFRLGVDWANKVITVAVLLPIWFVWLFVLVRNGVFVIDLFNIPLFLIALLLAIAVRFYLDMILAHVVLWTEQINGLAIVYHAVGRLFGGMVVPLMMLPAWAYMITKVLPFRYMYSFPVEVFQGLVPMTKIVQGFAVGIGWLVLEIIVYLGILRFGLKRYEAAGI